LSSANVTRKLKRSPVEVAFLSYLLLLSFLTLLNVSIGVAHPINEANVILFFGGEKKVEEFIVKSHLFSFLFVVVVVVVVVGVVGEVNREEGRLLISRNRAPFEIPAMESKRKRTILRFFYFCLFSGVCCFSESPPPPPPHL
jgi:hypothetical protein